MNHILQIRKLGLCSLSRVSIPWEPGILSPCFAPVVQAPWFSLSYVCSSVLVKMENQFSTMVCKASRTFSGAHLMVIVKHHLTVYEQGGGGKGRRRWNYQQEEEDIVLRALPQEYLRGHSQGGPREWDSGKGRTNEQWHAIKTVEWSGYNYCWFVVLSLEIHSSIPYKFYDLKLCHSTKRENDSPSCEVFQVLASPRLRWENHGQKADGFW